MMIKDDVPFNEAEEDFMAAIRKNELNNFYIWQLLNCFLTHLQSCTYGPYSVLCETEVSLAL